MKCSLLVATNVTIIPKTSLVTRALTILSILPHPVFFTLSFNQKMVWMTGNSLTLHPNIAPTDGPGVEVTMGFEVDSIDEAKFGVRVGLLLGC